MSLDYQRVPLDYVNLKDAWRRLGGAVNWLLATLFKPAYGGITKQTDTNYGTIGSGVWTVIDNWDAEMVSAPAGVTQDVANSGLRAEEPGVFRLTGVFAISFNDTNQGRVFGVRLYNATSATPGRVVEYYVGRNQDGVNISQAAILAEIPSAQVGDLLQIQIAGVGDSFVNVAVVDALFSMARVG